MKSTSTISSNLQKQIFQRDSSEGQYSKALEKLENELSPREKLVLKMRYGLYQGEEYTHGRLPHNWASPAPMYPVLKKVLSENSDNIFELSKTLL